MSDAEHQAFERDRYDSYDPENEAAALNQRLLRGLISRERVALAATLGHPIARELASSFGSEAEDLIKPQPLVDSLRDLATLLSQEGRSVAAQALHLLFQEIYSEPLDNPPYHFSQLLSQGVEMPSLDHDPLLRSLASLYPPYLCSAIEIGTKLMFEKSQVKSLIAIQYGRQSRDQRKLAFAICSILGSREGYLRNLVHLGLLMAILCIARQQHLASSPRPLPDDVTVEDLITPAHERLLEIYQEQLTPFLIQ